MKEQHQIQCTAFAGIRCIATGELTDVVMKVKKCIEHGGQEQILIFDDATGEQIEVDFLGTAEAVQKKLTERFNEDNQYETHKTEQVNQNHPKQGVVAHEVTLLPRHAEWLNRQPGGASVALRKLVEEARHANAGKDRLRQSKEAVYRFMYSIAGDQAGFEEISRALFNGNRDRFHQLTEVLPIGIRDHARKLALTAF